MRLVRVGRYEKHVYLSCPPPHTHLDACIAEDLQGGPDISLELVFHPGQTQQLHLHLQTLNHCGHLQRAVMDAELGLDVPCLGAGQGWEYFGWEEIKLV